MPTLGTGVFVYRRRPVSLIDSVELVRSQLNDPRAKRLCNILFYYGEDHRQYKELYGDSVATAHMGEFVGLSCRAATATRQMTQPNLALAIVVASMVLGMSIILGLTVLGVLVH